MEDTENELINNKKHFLTGSKETDLIVLSKLNDEDLLIACQTNKAINKACKNESFWKSRFISTFDKKFSTQSIYNYPSKYKKNSETWRNFYLKFVAYTSKYRLANSLLRIAAFKGEISLVVYALNEPKTKIDVYNGSPLITAAEGGYDDIIKYLINNGANINSNFLNWICGYGSLNIVKFVIEKKIDITLDDNYNIRIAANSGRFDIVEQLIKAGAGIHSKNDEILSHASRHGNMKMIKYLLDNGADINRIGGGINKPLTDAIKGGKKEIVKYLIQMGANVNADNGEALRNAIERGELEIVKELIKNGANINIVLKNDITPLQLAKNYEEFEIYQYLKNINK